MSSQGRFLGSTLLIAGTAIGAGMLALPVLTGTSGFLSTGLLMTAVWLFNLYVAYIILEATLRLPTHSNLISIIGASLGKSGQIITWVSCTLFLYALLVTYLSGLSELLLDTINHLWNISAPVWLSPLFLSIVFAKTLYFGTRTVDYMNRALSIGFAVTFIGLVLTIFPHASTPLLLSSQETNPLNNIPWHASTVIFGSFAYMIVIPSVRDYLHNDVKKIKKAIFMGSLLPLFLYLLWVGLIMAVIPTHGDASLTTLAMEEDAGTALTHILYSVTQSPYLAWFVRGFAFFAMATSFVGVALGLHDLLSDGLKLNQSRYKKSIVPLLTILPPFLFTFQLRDLFLSALILASEFAVLLHVILPVLAVWVARRQIKQIAPYMVQGGYIGLVLTLIVGVFLIFVDF